MLLALIIGCEIAFWIFLLLGLAVRYLARQRTLGTVILACVPLIDLVLLVATFLHLRGGAAPEITDGLAAAYIGVSVAFGPSIIRRIDARFAHRFAGGPLAPKPPKYGKERTRHEWQEFGKAVVAWVVSSALLLAGVALVGSIERGAVLLAWILRLLMVVLIWLIWPVSYEIWPRKPKGKQEAEQR
jgi:hypothetical protein